MLRRITAFFGSGLLSAFLSAVVSAAVPTEPPLEVYGSLPHTEAVEMSADGSLLAIVSTDDDQLVLTVKHADGKGSLVRLLRTLAHRTAGKSACRGEPPMAAFS